MVQMGARRWIRAAEAFNLQPSEFAKVGVALVLAKFFGENRGAPSWTDLAIGGVLTADSARARSPRSRTSARR